MRGNLFRVLLLLCNILNVVLKFCVLVLSFFTIDRYSSADSSSIVMKLIASLF